MTTANRITIFRILLVPFFVVQVLYYVNSGDEWHRFQAILAFGVAALSDAVDGYIARRYNQRSELGAFLDPLADKLLLVSGVVVLSFRNDPPFDRIPLWLTSTIISRDLLLLIGLVVIQMTCGKVRVQPRMTGKFATVFQMGTVLWILLQWHDAWLAVWFWGAAIFTGTSGLLYVWDGVRQLSASPSSAPSTTQS